MFCPSNERLCSFSRLPKPLGFYKERRVVGFVQSSLWEAWHHKELICACSIRSIRVVSLTSLTFVWAALHVCERDFGTGPLSPALSSLGTRIQLSFHEHSIRPLGSTTLQPAHDTCMANHLQFVACCLSQQE